MVEGFATSRKFPGWNPDKVLNFLIYLISGAALGPGVHTALIEMSTRRPFGGEEGLSTDGA
jgi:hypothetical protein